MSPRQQEPALDLIPPMRAAAILGISTDALLLRVRHPKHKALARAAVRLPSGHYRYSEAAVRAYAKRITAGAA